VSPSTVSPAQGAAPVAASLGQQSTQDDLIGRRILRGKTETQVIELLGRPTERMDLPGTSACQLSYYLGPERGPFGIDSETLCIEVSTDGKVSRQWIHRD